jgi:hypothetical protein
VSTKKHIGLFKAELLRFCYHALDGLQSFFDWVFWGLEKPLSGIRTKLRKKTNR